MNKLEEKNYYNELFSFYQDLLTINQQELFTSYYESDYSLSEIAFDRNITRSAVFDGINKTVKELLKFEEKLHLREMSQKRKEKYQELSKHVDNDGKNILTELQEME